MIRIESIAIREFRGIRNLNLKLNGQNFAACGPNGTGKSGIVDAIEFALTGNISRLSGAGTGGLSVKSHGPHVDLRDKPENAVVTLEVTIPSLSGRRARITRSVNAAGAPKIEPNDPEVLRAFSRVAEHPEFVLSRRELIRYVLSEPGERSKAVMALLRLEEIEKLRAVLQKIANAEAKKPPQLSRLKDDAGKRLVESLGIARPATAAILDAVNGRRRLLGLAELEKLEAGTSLREGVAATEASAPPRVTKIQATEDLRLFISALETLRAASVEEARTRALASATTLESEGQLADLDREAMLKSALARYDGSICPVCDTAFAPGAFEAHLAGKLARLERIGKLRSALEGDVDLLKTELTTVGLALNALVILVDNLPKKVDAGAIRDLVVTLRARYAQLAKLTPIPDTRAVLEVATNVPDLASLLAEIRAVIDAMPEPSAQDAARDYLLVAQERLESYRNLSRELNIAETAKDRAARAFRLYGEVTTSALEKIYADVQATFATYYRKVNEDDEHAFTAKLMVPAVGKLAFDVDFYGRGHFPPGAYHSEGHQDGMGLCLYLALMNHLLGDGFTFAVLDDVLMSVDAGHRRQVCNLLKTMFPNTQFIFTTHDEIWLRHMRSEGLVKDKGFAHFRTWTVETGPTEWDGRNVWEEIDGHLAKNDVRSAAALLRHHLEHFGKEACHRLRARVEYRSDAQFALEDVLAPATSALGDTLKKARLAATSWGHGPVAEKIVVMEAAFGEAKQQVNSDRWQMNAAVHFNEWASLDAQDFRPLAQAFRSFSELFSCGTCNEMLSITPAKGEKQGLRCGCGGTNWNLLGKKG